MLPTVFLAALSLLHCAKAQTDALANVTTAFSTAMIVPSVIDSFNPTEILNVTFTDSVTMNFIPVTTGALLTVEQTANEPQFSLTDSTSVMADPPANMNSSFVVIMVDPDAPTPQMPNVSQFLHFIGGDFTADSTGSLSNMSAALVEFFSPSPPDGSDPHRYVLLVFSQPTDFDTTGARFINATSDRTNFSVSAFAQSTNLGSPIAGNFFLVGPPSSDSSTATSASSSDSLTPPSLPLSTSDLPTPNLPSLTPASTVSTPPLPSIAAPVPTSHGIPALSAPKFTLTIAGLIALAIYLL